MHRIREIHGGGSFGEGQYLALGCKYIDFAWKKINFQVF
jgi:hypothetical protein